MRAAKELMRAGELYPGGDPELNRELDRCQSKLGALNRIPYERGRSGWRRSVSCSRRSARGRSSGRRSTAVARRAAWEQALPVTVADGVWLGAGALVCPAVSIGENTVVGAGSVVTRSLPAGIVAYGNPVRVIREIGERDRIALS